MFQDLSRHFSVNKFFLTVKKKKLFVKSFSKIYRYTLKNTCFVASLPVIRLMRKTHLYCKQLRTPRLNHHFLKTGESNLNLKYMRGSNFKPLPYIV